MVERTVVQQIRIAMIGGTGAIGKEIIRLAKNDPRVSHLALIGRRSLDEWKQEDYSPQLNIIIKPELDDFSDIEESLQGYNAFISCIGAEMKVGEKEFARIERDIPTSFAKTAAKVGG